MQALDHARGSATATATDADASSEGLFLAFVERRDAAYLERLLRHHQPQAYALAYRILGNDADADDALQEALVRLVQTSDRYDGSIAFAAWLGQLVRHAAVDQRRSRTSRARRERALVDEASAEGPPAGGEEERAAAIRRAVAELPETYRGPIELHYFGELSQEQTAQALGLKENAVAQRISRGRERLRESLRRRGIALSVLALVQALGAPPAAAAAMPGTLAATAIARAAAGGGKAVSGLMGPLAWIALAVIAGLAALAVVMLLAAPATTPAPEAAATVSPAPSPAAVVGPAVPAPLASAPRALGSRTWSFDSPDPGLEPSLGSWRHVRGAGVDGSGCMEVDAGGIIVPVALEGLKPPLRLTVQAAPLPPAPANGLLYFTFLPDGAELAQYGNVGRQRMLDIDDPASSVLQRSTTHISDDALDTWFGDGREVLAFYARKRPSSAWSLVLVGNWRLDDLRIEEVDAATLPDVQPYRDAVAAVPADRRQGIVTVPGLDGTHPDRPVTIRFTTYEPPPVTR